MIYNIHNENDWRQSVPRTCMCNADISQTIPTTLFLKTKYLKYHKISFKFRAIINLSCVPLNPWLTPHIDIQKSNLYCNGFIVKKLIYWSEHTHNRPGWRPKSYYIHQKSTLPYISPSITRSLAARSASWIVLSHRLHLRPSTTTDRLRRTPVYGLWIHLLHTVPLAVFACIAFPQGHFPSLIPTITKGLDSNDSRLHVVEPPRRRSFIWQIGVNSSIHDQRQVWPRFFCVASVMHVNADSLLIWAATTSTTTTIRTKSSAQTVRIASDLRSNPIKWCLVR